MRVGILGALEVVADGRLIDIGGARLRVLLIRLALDAGRAVTVESLTRALWPDDGPADPAHALQSLVSRLRKALPDESVLRFVPGGYVLDIPRDAVDLHRFERLVRDGRRALDRGEPQEAVRCFRAALGLWRGEALADVSDAPFAVAVAARFAELRLAAIEDRVTAELDLADPSARSLLPVAELQELVATHPFRERVRGLLIRALHAEGRHAEALTAYEDYRVRLAERLGADPGPELRAAHLAVLRGQQAPRRARPAGNLRLALTSFVGRERERHTIAVQLKRGRLVTLVGPGGVGKTRLATSFAAGLPGGAWLVELAAVTDPGDVPNAVISALELREDALPKDRSGDPVRLLAERLSPAETLIVLDNCEHVADAAAGLIETLLGRCPKLRVLATSREPLGIPGEALCPVPPLALTMADTRGEPGPAVRLFVDRAVAVRPGFTITEDNIDEVTAICRRLDGLPLAIELAAARLRTMSLTQLAARLEDRFQVLTRGSRTALPRHQTLRAVVDWSWDLLDPDVRDSAERLAVCAGSFTAEAASQLGATVDTLDTLVDKSLVQPVDAQEPRYRMLETIREYGIERLTTTGGIAQARAAHAACFLKLAERAETHLRGHDQLPWIAALTADNDNLTAAFQHACESGDSDTALRLGAALSLFWAVQGDHSGATSRLRTALSMPSDAPKQTRMDAAVGYLFHAALSGASTDDRKVVAALHIRGGESPQDAAVDALLALASDDPDAGLAAIDGCLSHASTWTRAMLWLARSFLHAHTGDSDRTCRDLVAAVAGFRAAGERWGLSTALKFLAYLRTTTGDFEGAIAALEESTGLAVELGLGDQQRVWLAMVRIHTADLDAAREELRAVVTRGESHRDVLMARLHLADLARFDGDLTQAALQLDRATADSHAYDSVSFRALLCCGRGKLAAAAGELETASANLAEALRLAAEMPDMPMVALVAVGIAMLRSRRSDFDGAGETLGAAHALRGAADEAHPDIAALVEALRHKLGERGLRACYGRGRGLRREDALALVASKVDC